MFHCRFLLYFICVSFACAQNQAGEDGYRRFEKSCSLCHGTDGTGGEFGPNISVRLPKIDDEQLATLIHGGLPKRGMPAFPDIEREKLSALIAFLRTLKAQQSAPVKRRVTTDPVPRLRAMF